MQKHGFTICICPDTKLLKAYIDDCLVKQKDIKESKPIWKKYTYWADEGLSNFWENINLQGLFSTHKAIILRNAHALVANNWKKLSELLGRPNEHIWIFVCLENDWEKNKPKIPAHITKLPCIPFAQKKGWVWQMNALNRSTLKTYLQKKAQSLNLSFTAEALNQLCCNIPTDAQTIENELQKLVLVADGQTVNIEMLSIINYNAEFSVFNLVKYIQTGSVQQIWAELKKNQNDNDSLLFPFLGLFLREARILWQISTNEPVYIHPQEVHNKTLIAKNLGQLGIIRLFDMIVQAELSVKSGKIQIEQCLELLIGDLILLFSRSK